MLFIIYWSHDHDKTGNVYLAKIVFVEVNRF